MKKPEPPVENNSLENFLDLALSIVQDQNIGNTLEQTQERLKTMLADKKDDTLDNLDNAFKDFNKQYTARKQELSTNTRQKLEGAIYQLQNQRNLLFQCRNEDVSGLAKGYKSMESLNGVPLYPGDVLMAIRSGGLYQHFSVYAGQQQVIHYAAQQGDFGDTLSIHQAPFEEFQLDSQEIYILDFPQECGHPSIRLPKGTGQGWYKKEQEEECSLFTIIRSAFYHLYSPEETIARARSRIGESKYTVPFNNCEHFAIWCKTGVAESYQVNSLISKFLKDL